MALPKIRRGIVSAFLLGGLSWGTFFGINAQAQPSDSGRNNFKKIDREIGQVNLIVATIRKNFPQTGNAQSYADIDRASPSSLEALKSQSESPCLPLPEHQRRKCLEGYYRPQMLKAFAQRNPQIKSYCMAYMERAVGLREAESGDYCRRIASLMRRPQSRRALVLCEGLEDENGCRHFLRILVKDRSACSQESSRNERLRCLGDESFMQAYALKNARWCRGNAVCLLLIGNKLRGTGTRDAQARDLIQKGKELVQKASRELVSLYLLHKSERKEIGYSMKNAFDRALTKRQLQLSKQNDVLMKLSGENNLVGSVETSLP